MKKVISYLTLALVLAVVLTGVPVVKANPIENMWTGYQFYVLQYIPIEGAHGAVPGGYSPCDMGIGAFLMDLEDRNYDAYSSVMSLAVWSVVTVECEVHYY